MAGEARSHLSLSEVGTEEFLQKLTSQITEMVSAKITQGETRACGVGTVTPCARPLGLSPHWPLGSDCTGGS